MGSRLELHDILKDTLGIDNVYFQPPETIKLIYPCVIYNLLKINTEFADNLPYQRKKAYQFTIVDHDPDSEYPDIAIDLPLCAFDRFYTADNLNHWVFTIYF